MGEHKPEGQSKSRALVLFLAPLAYLAAAVAVIMIVCHNGAYPSGADTMYHVYRGQWIYHSVSEGNWWPLIDPMWYNGVELLRYWPPMAAYFMAFCQFLAGGNALYGYLVFVGMICFLGGLPWLYMGCKRDRPWMGAFLGLLWFFMPNNLYALFGEGNLARSVSMIFLPVLMYQVYAYLESPSWKHLLWIVLSFALVTLCHLGYGGMVALGILLFLLVDKLVTRRKRGALHIFAAILLGFLVLGVWLVPSLIGGITKMDSSEVMDRFFQSAWISLNPFERLESDNEHFYFGLAAFILAVFGSICAQKTNRPGFVTGIVILLCTTTAMYPVMKILPGSQYLWMLRFISIALCLILCSFLFWKNLKRPLTILLAVLLCLDTIPSFGLMYAYRTGETAEHRFDAWQKTAFIDQGQQLEPQRIALMDLAAMGASGAWMVSAWNDPVPSVFGAGWEASVTGTNIAQINRALEGGFYNYMFDRCLELGSNCLVALMSQADKESDVGQRMDAAAEKFGFTLVDHSDSFSLYYRDIEGTWGTKTKYNAIGIGTTARYISLSFPAVKETASSNLNDYTFEELSRYDLVFLSGFMYDDRGKAEELVTKLSKNGTRVVIAADGVPESRETRDRSFLGAVCNPISFENGYPEIDTVDGVLNPDLFPVDHTDWSTVYVEGLDHVWGTVEEADGVKLDFYGTVKNDNIVFVGLNLPYFLSLTGDKSVETLLGRAMDLSADALPEREIVPLTVTYEKNAVTVVSPEDNVNTSLAYHGDLFRADREIREENHLTLVDKGTTVITLRYPHFWFGAAVNVAGILLTVLFLVTVGKREQNLAAISGEKTLQEEKKEEDA